ncbi:unknown [Clostridium sp. CAG:413]|nr:unknown [Clostridium sp. CAG:413]
MLITHTDLAVISTHGYKLCNTEVRFLCNRHRHPHVEVLDSVGAGAAAFIHVNGGFGSVEVVRNTEAYICRFAVLVELADGTGVVISLTECVDRTAHAVLTSKTLKRLALERSGGREVDVASVGLLAVILPTGVHIHTLDEEKYSHTTCGVVPSLSASGNIDTVLSEEVLGVGISRSSISDAANLVGDGVCHVIAGVKRAARNIHSVGVGITILDRHVHRTELNGARLIRGDRRGFVERRARDRKDDLRIGRRFACISKGRISAGVSRDTRGCCRDNVGTVLESTGLSNTDHFRSCRGVDCKVDLGEGQLAMRIIAFVCRSNH